MVLWRLASYWQMVCCHGNIAPKTSTYNWFRNSCPTHQSMQCKRCYHLTTLLRGYFRLKLSPTSGCCPWWLIFLKNLFYQKNYHILLAASYHGILRLKHNWMLPSSSGTSQNILKHKYALLAKSSSKKPKRQSTFSSPPPFKTLALSPPDQNRAPGSTQSSITVKFSKTKHLKQGSLDNFLKVIHFVG